MRTLSANSDIHSYYSPDQDRDEEGQFAPEGGGGSSGGGGKSGGGGGSGLKDIIGKEGTDLNKIEVAHSPGKSRAIHVGGKSKPAVIVSQSGIENISSLKPGESTEIQDRKSGKKWVASRPKGALNTQIALRKEKNKNKSKADVLLSRGLLLKGTKFIERSSTSKHYDSKDLQSIKDVEVFKVGMWNGDHYSKDDLDEIVNAFDKVGFQVPIKLGHDDKSGAPAYGWVEHIRRVGDKLVADFKDLPKQLWQLIKDRRFDAVSAEIFWDLNRNNKLFRRVLKAVALLGAETPGVSDLAPLRTVVNTEKVGKTSFVRLTAYTFNIDKEFDMKKSKKAKKYENDKDEEEEDEEEKNLEELTAQVKDLQEEVDSAKVELAEAQKKVQMAMDEDEDDDEDMKKKKNEMKAKADEDEEKAKNKVDKLSADLSAAQSQITKLTKAQSGEIAELKKTVESLTGKIGRMSEDRRKERISQKLKNVPIPSLRTHIEALYDIASTSSRVVKFTEQDGDGKSKTSDISVEDLVDRIVAHLNSNAAKLFSEIAQFTGSERQDGSDPLARKYDGLDPSAKVHQLATERVEGQKSKDYGTAVQAVLADKSNKELAADYANFTASPKSKTH